MTTLPPEISYGYVADRLLLAVADGPDLGREPDAKPAAGSVTFTPAQKVVKVSAPTPARVLPQPITVELDDSGYLVDSQGERGVWLPTGVYAVSYKFTGITVPQHQIVVTDGHSEEAPLYLTVAAPPGGPVVAPSEYAELSARMDALGFQADDTGWVDVAWLSTSNGLTISAQQARRSGPTVHYRLTAIIGATGSNVGYAASAVTAGWRPPAALATGVYSYDTGAYLGGICMNSSGTILIRATNTGTVNLNYTWGTA